MDNLLIIFILTAISFPLGALLLINMTSSPRVRATYFSAIRFVGSQLPIVSWCLVFGLLMTGFLPKSENFLPALRDISVILSRRECLVLFVCSPLLFTRFGNLLATVILLYCINKLVWSAADPAAGIGAPLLLAALTCIAVIGDKMPWRSAGRSPVTDLLRSSLILVLAFGGIALIAVSALQLGDFHRWTTSVIPLDLSRNMLILSLILLFIGWVSVALNYGVNLILLFLALPSVLLFSYVVALPSQILVVLLASYLGLAFHSGDQTSKV